MMSRDEAQRLAAMGNVLRSDWPAGSLLTLISQDLRHRTYRDVAIALAVIATDPDTKTPGRLREAGPWWEAARPIGPTSPRGNGRCPNCDVFHTSQSPCNVRDVRADHRRPGAALARAELHNALGTSGDRRTARPTEPADEETEA